MLFGELKAYLILHVAKNIPIYIRSNPYMIKK